MQQDYNEFLKKFEAKKTTDDCYTPPNIYRVVADYVSETYDLDKSSFVRPFYPGGDFENFDYTNAVVVDNPPFSILAKIIEYYHEKDIKYFLFCQGKTALSNIGKYNNTAICVGIQIEYENKAVVNTSFITNLEPENAVRSDPHLCNLIKQANAENAKKLHKQLPKYRYSNDVLTAAECEKYSKHGVKFSVERKDCVFVRGLDSQKPHKKTIFGGGLILSRQVAARREKFNSERALEKSQEHDFVWELSDREKEIQNKLG